MKPFFSICIPVYNACDYIERTIESVLDQDFEDFEIVILDNASTDGTSQLIDRYVDERLRIVRNKVTVPPDENWTRVVNLAEGKWTKLVCADDLLKKGALAKISEDIEKNPQVSVHVGRRDIIDETDAVVLLPQARFSEGQVISRVEIAREAISTGTNVLGESVCIAWKSDLTADVGPFSTQWKYFIDMDYWLRLAHLSDFVCTSSTIGSFRISKGSWTSNIGLQNIKESKQFFSSHDDFSEFSKFRKTEAIVRATFRSVMRQAFLNIKLRRK